MNWQKVTESHPENGQMVLVCWPEHTNSISKRTYATEFACFTLIGLYPDGRWEYSFKWGSGRFGHSGILDTCLWCAFNYPNGV